MTPRRADPGRDPISMRPRVGGARAARGISQRVGRRPSGRMRRGVAGTRLSGGGSGLGSLQAAQRSSPRRPTAPSIGRGRGSDGRFRPVQSRTPSGVGAVSPPRRSGSGRRNPSPGADGGPEMRVANRDPLWRPAIPRPRTAHSSRAAPGRSPPSVSSTWRSPLTSGGAIRFVRDLPRENVYRGTGMPRRSHAFDRRPVPRSR